MEIHHKWLLLCVQASSESLKKGGRAEGGMVPKKEKCGKILPQRELVTRGTQINEQASRPARYKPGQQDQNRKEGLQAKGGERDRASKNDTRVKARGSWGGSFPRSNSGTLKAYS